MTPRQDRLVLWWRRPHLAAALALLVAGWASLGWAMAGRGVAAGETLPVDGARVQQADLRIDSNTASAASLQRLPRVSKMLAQAIIDWRTSHPSLPFRSADDLRRVPRFGPALVSQIQPFLAFGHAATGGTESTVPAEE